SLRCGTFAGLPLATSSVALARPDSMLRSRSVGLSETVPESLDRTAERRRWLKVRTCFSNGSTAWSAGESSTISISASRTESRPAAVSSTACSDFTPESCLSRDFRILASICMGGLRDGKVESERLDRPFCVEQMNESRSFFGDWNSTTPTKTVRYDLRHRDSRRLEARIPQG